MNWSVNSTDRVLATTQAPLAAASLTDHASHASSVTSPKYRRHTATQALGSEAWRHNPLMLSHEDVAFKSSEGPLSPPTPSISSLSAPDLPDGFCRIPFAYVSPAPERGAADGDESIVMSAAPLGLTRRSMVGATATHATPHVAPSTSRESLGLFNLGEFSPFQRPVMPSLSHTAPSLDDSLRSSFVCAVGGVPQACASSAGGGGSGSVPGFAGGYARSARRSVGTGLLADEPASMLLFGAAHGPVSPPPPPPLPSPPQPPPPAAPQRPSATATATASSAPRRSTARRLTSTDNGPLAAHRLLPEITLAEVCGFLENAGREMEDVALQRAIANGESCLSAGNEESSLTSPRQRTSESLVSPVNGSRSGRTTPRRGGRGGGEGFAGRDSTSSASGSPERARSARDQQEEEILRLVEASDFPFKEKYHNYQFTEPWFAGDGPACSLLCECVSLPHDGEAATLTEAETVTEAEAVQPLVALTEDPPLFVHGMLLDPLSNAFLFGGHGFRQEARVLTTLIYTDDATSPGSGGRKVTSPGRRTTTTTTNVPPLPPLRHKNKNSPGATRSSPVSQDTREGRPVKVLQRDFFSLARRDGCGFMVQTLSLLPLSAPVEANKQQLVSAEALRRVLPLVGAATLSRAFPLSHIAHEALVKVQDGAGQDTSASLDTTPTTAKHGRSRHHSQRDTAGTSASAMRWSLRPSHDGVTASSVFRGTSPSTNMRSTRTSDGTYIGSSNTSTAAGASGALELMGAVDAIKKYLLHYRIGRFRAHIRLYEEAVRRVQRFLRACLAKKQRALQRMLRLWRRLEVESRLKLAHYDAPPSSMERVDMVANTVLQQHMLTTRDSKVRLIADLWQQRRLAYVLWRRRGGGGSSDAPQANAVRVDHAAVGGLTNAAEAENSVKDAQLPRRLLAQRLSKTAVLAAADSIKDVPEATQRTRHDREQAFRHTQFGWYISPEALLLESHKRLLEGLKQSILSMEQVRYELERAAATSTTTTTPANTAIAAASLSKRQPGQDTRPIELTQDAGAVSQTSESGSGTAGTRQTPQLQRQRPLAHEGPCGRTNCLWGLAPADVLERKEAKNVPTQHNRGVHTMTRPDRFRTDLCRHVEKDQHCCNGALCWMAHSKSQQRTVEMNRKAGITTLERVQDLQKAELESAVAETQVPSPEPPATETS